MNFLSALSQLRYTCIRVFNGSGVMDLYERNNLTNHDLNRKLPDYQNGFVYELSAPDIYYPFFSIYLQH